MKHSENLLPNLGERKISAFEDVYSKDPPRTVTLNDFLKFIRNPPTEHKKNLVNMRKNLADGNKQEYDSLKKKLPNVKISGEFAERKQDSLQEYSGLLQGDFDKLDDPVKTRDLLATDPHVCASFVSPSAEGVKAVILVPSEAKRHKESFLVAEKYFKNKYGLQIDRSCKDIGRHFFASYDPDLKINQHAIPLALGKTELVFDATNIDPFPQKTEKSDLERATEALSFIPPASDYDLWLEIGMSLKDFLGTAGYSLWDSWSAKASNYESKVMAQKWASFNGVGRTASTIFHYARQNGYTDEGSRNEAPFIIKQAGNKPDKWPEPQKLPDAPIAPPELDVNILPEPLRKYAEVMSLENEVSPEGVAVIILAALGSVTGTRFCIQPDYRKKSYYEFPVRSAGLVMKVSENKSGIFKAGIGPVLNLQRGYKVADKQKLEENKAEFKIFDRKEKGLLKRLGKLQEKGVSTTDVETEIKNLKPPEKIDERIITVDSGTRESYMETISQGNQRGLLVQKDELSGWFADLTKDGRDGDRQFFIEAMTVAKDKSHSTISRGRDEVENLAISVCGTIQRSNAKRLLFDMEKKYKDDGLLQRFMWVFPKTVNYREFDKAYQNGDTSFSAELHAKTYKLFQDLDNLSPENIGASSAPYAPAPFVCFDDDAQGDFFKWRAHLKDVILNAENMTDGLISHLSKSERLVSGLALTFHCIKCANATVKEKNPTAVDAECFARAVKVWEILRKHAEIFYNLDQLNDIESAHYLWEKLKELEQSFSARDLKQKRWSELRDENSINNALDLLVAANRIIEIEPQKLKKGRPLSRQFVLNPKKPFWEI